MDAEAGEFQDWEVLHPISDSEPSLINAGGSDHNDFEEIDTHSNGMIQTDYFSLDSQQDSLTRTVSGADVSEGGSENSDNPSWIDPGSETRYPRKDLAGFWTDSSSDRSDDRKFHEFEGKNEVGFVGNEKQPLGFEGIEEIRGGNEKNLENFEKFWSDVGGIELGSMKFGNFAETGELSFKENANSDVSDEDKSVKEPTGVENHDENVEIEARKVGEVEKKKTIVWWKVPMEFLKYCVFRVSPVWTFSVAAAVLGFVILGRRLYKMKKKTPGIELKVTVDDKKVSQFMSRAARLNEAFSVVKRVPVIRPSFPAVGVTPWPVMSLR